VNDDDDDEERCWKGEDGASDGEDGDDERDAEGETEGEHQSLMGSDESSPDVQTDEFDSMAAAGQVSPADTAAGTNTAALIDPESAGLE
jgi:hypothetical protein